MADNDTHQWRRYLTTFHDEHPSITERLLGNLDGEPYRWLVEPLRNESGLIVDLACGSAPTRELLPKQRWIGVDASSAELAAASIAARGPLVQADTSALPLPDGAARAVCAAMCLQVVTPLVDTLAEITRILQPGGILAALVPARLGASPADWLGWLRVSRAVGALPAWPNPEACDGLARLLRKRGFAIRGNQRRTFDLHLHTPGVAALLIDSLYLPHTDPDRLVAAKQAVAGWARPGRRLALPLRRVVAQQLDQDHPGRYPLDQHPVAR